jgi:GNAT superfamily N-acetyltransferase
MENFICKVANREELLKRWDYLIKIHPGNNKWVKFKENALKHYDEKSTISYLGFLNDEIICEATAYINDSAFIGDISEPSGLLSDSMAYLAAFRTNKEYEGKGYFGKLYRFIENDLKEKGYTELCLGVGPEEVRNIEIYFHLGFTNYIKTLIEETTSKEEVILFYKKKI